MRGGQSSNGASFFQVLQFPLLLTHHHSSFGAGTIGQIVANMPSELSLTPRNIKNVEKINACISLESNSQQLSLLLNVQSCKLSIIMQNVCRFGTAIKSCHTHNNSAVHPIFIFMIEFIPITVLDIFLHPVLFKNTTFPSSGGTYSDESDRKS
jgi:hypothetical protein